MQKSLKMLPNNSSTSTFPTIIPRCLVANLKSSAAISKSFADFCFLNFSKWWTQLIKFCLCLSLVIKISSLVENLLFSLLVIFFINLFKFEFFLIDIKTFSYFFNFLFNLPFIKSDLLKKQLDPQIKKLDHVLISIIKNSNLDILINKITRKLKDKFINSEDVLITRERHRQHLEQCVEHLINFADKNKNDDLDKGAEDLRLATRHLGIIVGKVDVEEILGSIFNDFCIGK